MKKTVEKTRPAGYLTEREYQHCAKAGLDRLYGEVKVQWYPFPGEKGRMYAPVVDIAVGPFALDARYEEEYTHLLRRTRPFIERLIAMHNQNVENVEPASFDALLHFNENARCLLCIEVEDSGSKKHCLGNLVNASALGRVGLLVARSERAFRTFLRQRVYLRFLAEVGKNTFKTANTLVLTAEQFDDCLPKPVAALADEPRDSKRAEV